MINEALDLFFELKQEIRKKEEEYRIKCKKLDLDSDEKAFNKLINYIDSLAISEEEKEVLQSYIYTWFDFHEQNY